MPSLGQLHCSIKWSGTDFALEEHRTTYGNGRVETFIPVPSHPSSFSVHLKSAGFVAPGLAAFVYIDGKYQANRNCMGLSYHIPGASDSHHIADLRLEGAEISMAGGRVIRMPWHFARINELPNSASPDPDVPFGGEFVGTIEIVVLRMAPDDALVPSGLDGRRPLQISPLRSLNPWEETRAFTYPEQPSGIQSLDGISHGTFDAIDPDGQTLSPTFDGSASRDSEDDHDAIKQCSIEQTKGMHCSTGYDVDRHVHHRPFQRHTRRHSSPFVNHYTFNFGNNPNSDSQHAREQYVSDASDSSENTPPPSSPTELGSRDPGRHSRSSSFGDMQMPGAWIESAGSQESKNTASDLDVARKRSKERKQQQKLKKVLGGDQRKEDQYPMMATSSKKVEEVFTNNEPPSNLCGNCDGKSDSSIEAQPMPKSVQSLQQEDGPVNDNDMNCDTWDSKLPSDQDGQRKAGMGQDYAISQNTTYGSQDPSSHGSDEGVQQESGTPLAGTPNQSQNLAPFGSGDTQLPTSAESTKSLSAIASPTVIVPPIQSNTPVPAFWHSINQQTYSNPVLQATLSATDVAPGTSSTPYWQAWHKAREDGLPLPQPLFDPRAAETQRLYSLPTTLIERHGMTHQTQTGVAKPVQIKKRLGRYIDTMEKPYAVFLFRYRNEATLSNLTGSRICESPEVEFARLMALSKEELLTRHLEATRNHVSVCTRPPVVPTAGPPSDITEMSGALPTQPPRPEQLHFEPQIDSQGHIQNRSGDNASTAGSIGHRSDENQPPADTWASGASFGDEGGSIVAHEGVSW